MSSDFDALMDEADQQLMDTFGTECGWIPAPGAQQITIQVDIQKGLSLQRLGERHGRGKATRQGQQMTGSILEKDLPADFGKARLVIDGVKYVLSEPQPNGGEVEFLLQPEKPAGTGGDSNSTFF